MQLYNASYLRVAESIEKVLEEEKLDTEDDSIEILVWDKNVVMCAVENDEMDERNIERDYVESLVCTLKIQNQRDIQLTFHEESVEEEFQFNPAGRKAISPQQATQPQELGELLNIVVSQINYAYDISKWDFCSLNAASIARGGYLTDYEFKFEASM